jgi:hypothetical protein
MSDLGPVGRMRARALAERALWDSLGTSVEDADPWRLDAREAVADAAERADWEVSDTVRHAAENITESARREAIKRDIQRFRHQ